MEISTMLPVILMGAILLGLVAIWRELRIVNGATRARRWSERVVLPMSASQAKVKPGQSAEITARGNHSFKPERIHISNAGTPGGAVDWIVNDIKLAGKSVFEQSGDIPGDMFATGAVNSFLTFRTIEPGQSVQMIVTYIGPKDDGVPFYASLVGTVARKKPSRDQRRDTTIVEAATA